jgi:hypothetical protein
VLSTKFEVKVEPYRFKAPVVLPAVKIEPAVEARMVFPVDPSPVKAPVEAVVAPMAVLLIPVAVVLKLADVKVISLAPVLMLDAPSPDKARDPDVAVKLKAPVVWVNPFEAVKVPAEVMVPVPVVPILPEVDRVPASVMVKVGEPPD